MRGASRSRRSVLTWGPARRRWALFLVQATHADRESRSLAVDLEQARAALATADAHGHDAPLRLAPTALLQNVAGKPRAGHSEGMADGDRAAIDVVLVGIDAKLATGIEALP